MSITLWYPRGICGLPVMGEPFDEFMPPNSILEASPLVCRVLDVMHRRDAREKGRARMQRYRESHSFPPRKDRELKNLNFLWLSLLNLQSINFEIESVEDTIHMRKFAHCEYIRQDFPIVVRTLPRMNNLNKNFYRVVSSSGASYVKSSSTELTVDERDFYLSLQPCLLPLRDGGLFHVDPYFPHRFAHQFGYN
ncbi:hypothetical protein ACLOJK_019204 [Asimina triloba]